MVSGSLTRSVPSRSRSVGRHAGRDPAQEAAAAAGREVADRAAQEGDRARALRARDPVQVALEVPDHAVHVEARVLLDQVLGGLAHDRLGHVEGQVAAQRARLGHRVEEHAGLRGVAGAELEQLLGLPRRDDVGRVGLEDRPLGARRVVLGELADLVEQLRAARVVEVLRRQLLERLGQPVEHVVGERALVALGEPRVDPDLAVDAGGLHAHASQARRTPEKIWRRWGRSQLRKVALATRRTVAHEPPRRTL